jgi:hypothetical protein
VTQARREVVERDHTENVGKRPLDASGKDPVNEDREKILRAAVSLRDSGFRHCERSEAIQRSLRGETLDCFGAMTGSEKK